MAETAQTVTPQQPITDVPAGTSAAPTLSFASKVDRVLIICALVSLPIMCLVPLNATGYWMNLLTSLFLYATMASAWNLIGGYTGYAAFGNIAFFGGGAYTTAEFMLRAHWPFFPSMLMAGVTMACFGALVGLPVLRLKGHYFAIATLGVAITTREITNNLEFFNASRPFNLPLINNPNLFYFSPSACSSSRSCSPS